MQTPEEFARHLLRCLTCTSDQRFIDDAAKDIAARDAEIAEEATRKEAQILLGKLSVICREQSTVSGVYSKIADLLVPRVRP